MRRTLILLSLFGAMMALTASEASALVCARGVYRAGCIGPRGVVGVRRGIYGRRAFYGRRVFYGRPAFRRW
jgi:hypothetical protein